MPNPAFDKGEELLATEEVKKPPWGVTQI